MLASAGQQFTTSPPPPALRGAAGLPAPGDSRPQPAATGCVYRMRGPAGLPAPSVPSP